MAVGEALVSYGKRKARMLTDFGTFRETKDCIREGAAYRRGGDVERLGDSHNLRTILGWCERVGLGRRWGAVV